MSTAAFFPKFLFSKLVDDAVEQALRLDAACVVVNLLMLPDQPQLHFACIEKYLQTQTALRSFRHAADDRAACDAIEREEGRLHGRTAI